MSLIIYKDNVLSVDKSSFIINPNSLIASKLEKYYVHSTKQFAFIYTGNDISQHTKFFKAFIKLLYSKIKLLEENDALEISVEFPFPFNEVFFLIMTANNTYYVAASKETEKVNSHLMKFNRIAGDSYCAAGSASMIATALLANGFDIDHIYKKAFNYGRFLFRTDVVKIYRKDLVPF